MNSRPIYFVLVMVIGLSLQTLSLYAETSGEETPSYWHEVGLNFDQVKKNITTSFCYGDEQSKKQLQILIQCVGLIDTALAMHKPALILSSSQLIESTSSDLPVKYGEVFEDFGAVQLVAKNSDEMVSMESLYNQMALFAKSRFDFWQTHFEQENRKNIDFNQLIDWIEKNLVNTLSEEEQSNLSAQLFNGYLQVIDPHAHIVSIAEYQEDQPDEKDSLVGMGAMLSRHEEGIQIFRVYNDSPAKEAGLIPGDIIQKIGQDVETPVDVTPANMDFRSSLDLIVGEADTGLHLWVKRKGREELILMNLVRRKVTTDYLFVQDIFEDGEMDGEPIKTAHLVVSSFMPPPGQFCLKFYRTLLDLESQNVKGLILDLRSNPGGHVQNAECMVTMLVSGKQDLVSFRNPLPAENGGLREPNEGETISAQFEQAFGFVLTVLINGSSASASEMVSGTVQNIKRGFVLGETSFGKGVRQTGRPLIMKNESLFPFDLDNAEKILLFYTDAQFFFESGEKVWSNHLVGVEPDFEAEFDPFSEMDSDSFKEKYLYAEAYPKAQMILPFDAPENREWAIDYLEHCSIQTGFATERYQNPDKTGDFQVLKTRDILSCIYQTFAAEDEQDSEENNTENNEEVSLAN